MTRCARSDLPTSMCAHCAGHDLTGPPGEPAPRTPPAAPAAAPVVRAATLTPAARRRAYTALPRHRNFPAACVYDRCRVNARGEILPPRPTDGRANICPVCEDRTRGHLEWVAEQWPALEEALPLTPARGDAKVNCTADTDLPVNRLVSNVMTAVDETFAFYARLVRDERGAVFPLTDPTPRDVALWLARTHLPWLATHPDRDDSPTELVRVQLVRGRVRLTPPTHPVRDVSPAGGASRTTVHAHTRTIEHATPT